ncbi:MAG TPA: EF-hand domain-containing protein [Candidatus Hydrogenedentes bacterium]|nr:EF-hand domain-containing protein [Candidatus Hydrogenedentota bacterium]HPG70345.1 EF-hand domain-containing protein [Candidatus Hydrogenedentota bacterium]
MKPTVITLLIVGTGLVVGSVSLAQPSEPVGPTAPADGPRECFKRADTNGDGSVSFEEFAAVAPHVPRGRFDRWDRCVGAGGMGGRGGGIEGRRSKMMKRLREADADHDERLTYGEIAAVRPQFPETVFKQLDHNADGTLSKEDRPEGRGFGPGPAETAGGSGRGDVRPWCGKGFAGKADADRNGALTFDEWAAEKAHVDRERFAKLDTNGDGALTSADAPRGGKGEGRRGQRGPGVTEAQGGGPGGRDSRGIRARLREADSDGDKRITPEEAQKAQPDMTPERFKKMDRNGDGVISPEDKQHH